jgi:hypothetical protein
MFRGLQYGMTLRNFICQSRKAVMPDRAYGIYFLIGKQDVELITFFGKLEGSDGTKDEHTRS